MKVKLETKTGELVTHEYVIPMALLPEMIMWGERFFLLYDNFDVREEKRWHTGTTVPIYREGLLIPIPTPLMYKEQAQALTAQGTLPQDCR